MSGPKRNEDSLNTIGVVVVGICGAVMVYVSITALQAFYMNDTSELQTMADYGGQDTTAKSHKAEEMRNITEPQMGGTPSISIDKAMDLVIANTKEGKPVVPAVQVGANGQAFKPKATEVPHAGVPELIAAPAAPAGAGSADGAAGAPPAGTGSGSGAGSGTAPATTPNTTDGKKTTPAGGQVDNTNVQTQLHTTGSPADKKAVPGGGGAPAGGQGSAQRLVPNTGTNTGSGGHAR